MGTTFQEADENVQAMVKEALRKYHSALFDEHVTVSTMFAHRITKDEESLPALKDRGMEIFAKIQVTALVDRARGVADSKLTICAKNWELMDKTRLMALIDHELQHLALIQLRPTKKEPYRKGPKHDDLGRPVLRIRPHDYYLAGFAKCVERHAASSVEMVQLATLRAEYGQLLLFG